MAMERLRVVAAGTYKVGNFEQPVVVDAAIHLTPNLQVHLQTSVLAVGNGRVSAPNV